MKRMHRKKLSLAVGQVLSAGVIVGLAVPLAYGQQPAPEKIEKLEITGSRIPSPNLESTSPVTVINARDIAFEHPVSVENLLNNLPQVFADMGNMLSNGATGTAVVDLRGLGSNRTLVLVNGRRLPAGSPLEYAADLNQIALPLIQRVEILTGGASAVYGSDAIAGVVNFIMNDHFQGVQLDAGYSFYNHSQHNSLASVVAARAATNPAQFKVPGDVDSDGEVSNYDVTIGGDFANGKGNATVFMGYERSHAVVQGNRDYSACATGSNSHGLTCSGSGTSATGQFVNLGANGTPGAFTIADNMGGVRPFTSNDQFNFAPYNYYQRPDERYNVNAFAHYDIAPWMRSYVEFGFHDDHTLAQIAPSGAFGVEIHPSAANPLLSNAFLTTFGASPGTPGDVLILRRNVEGGGRVDDLRHTSFRGVLGFKGEVLGGWDYDVWYQLGKVLLNREYHNDMSVVRIGRALNVVTNPANGQPVCQSVLDGTDPNCVPWNIFSLGGVSPAALNYLQTPGFATGFTEQSVFGGTLTGDLGMYGMKSAWASSGVGVAGGIEHRTEKLQLNTDLEFSTGDLAGQGGPTLPLNGQYSVNEIYAEVNVPIIEDRQYAKLLSINGSARYSDYTTGKHTTTYGIGAEWAPVKEVRFRGSYQKAVRAANVVELFTAQGLNLFAFSADPCGGPTPSATLAQCLATGLKPNQYGTTILTNPAGQGNYLQGGNPNLDPERAKTYTAGAVFQPLKNLSGSIDYWQITVDNAIGRVNPTLALSQCISNGTFCDLIHRDPSLGTLWLNGGAITGTNVNLTKLKTSGVDFAADYSMPIAWGSLSASFKGTWVRQNITNSGVGDYDCVGLAGPTCGTPTPKWRHNLRGTWSTPWNVDFSATWRYIDSVKLDASSSNPLLASSFNQVDLNMGARSYLDLAASWAITKQVTLWAGVNNVTDRDPPIISSAQEALTFGSGNTYPQVYDALGRRVFVSVTAKF
ncbi:MAG TPA: TonB-dependent receptor [Casimicrobiaceae bacterium]|nr:TonB-dependent receptor [Casimicrobiaceae bacterium]